MTFVDGPVTVTVPATSANLGPGYDALGLALDRRDRLRGEIVSGGLEIEVHGAGAADVPRDERHLVVRAMRTAFEAMGGQPPGLRLWCDNLVPHARGMGSSSAAIVGGLTLARALVAGGELVLDDESLLQLAAEIEGHPDNVAPAFLGGFTVAGSEGNEAAPEYFAVRGSVDPRISVVVFIPPHGVETTLARGVLPATVPHAEAAANAGRTALLVAALNGQPEQLLRATRDYLHQEYRRPAMPDTLALVEELRGDGIAAIVSGAGPTVLAFADGVDSTMSAKLLARCPEGWTGHAIAVDLDGARVE